MNKIYELFLWISYELVMNILWNFMNGLLKFLKLWILFCRGIIDVFIVNVVVWFKRIDII